MGEFGSQQAQPGTRVRRLARAAARSAIAAGALTLVTPVVGAGAQTAPLTESAQVTFIQGVPNAVVDVVVDGRPLASGLAAEQLTAVQPLSAGSHQFRVTTAGASPTNAAFAEQQLTLPAGANVSVVLHVEQSAAKPALAAFTNDVSPVPAGKGRLTARHLSTLPTVDVYANGGLLIPGFAPGANAAMVVDAATYAVAVEVPPNPGIAFGPLPLPVTEGEVTIVNVIGAATGQFAPYSVVVQRIGGLGTAPAGVNAGNSGLAAEPSGTSRLPWLLAAVAATVVGCLFGIGRLRAR